MLWICLTAWAGAVHLVFPDEKKGGRSQIGETDFLPCSDRVYSGHCTLPSDRSAKSSGDEKRNFNWNGVP